MTKGSNFWVIGGEFGSMNFHKLVEGSAQVKGRRPEFKKHVQGRMIPPGAQALGGIVCFWHRSMSCGFP
jgi:hypothetical protein